MEGLRQDTRQVVDRLERQVARLRTGLWFMSLLVLGSLGVLGYFHLHPKAAPTAATLRVRGLVVEDEHGTARVVFGAPGLRLLDAQGRERGGLLLLEDGGAALTLKDKQGALAFTALAGAEEGATVALRNQKQEAVLLSTTQGPTLQIHRGGKVLVKQPYDAQDLK